MFGGGFFTDSICSAIITKFDQADLDGDGALSIDEVRRWLEARANDHNANYPKLEVPTPKRLGFGHGEAFLTLPPDAWFIHEIPLGDGLPAVVLPTGPILDTFALALGRYPVTNRAYKTFVQEIGYHPPSGKKYDIKGRWIGPFSPWSEPAFSDPDQPVVCVTAADVSHYCGWLGARMEASLIAPPTPEMWDLAAFGNPDPARRNSRVWLSTTVEIHHKDIAPRPCINALAARTNSRGYTDMIGNVWEWCGSVRLWQAMYPHVFPDDFGYELQTLGPAPPAFEELRGGGFLDDLERVQPFINVSTLPDAERTSHSDLGFRVAILIALSELPEEISDRVKNIKPLYPDYRPAFISRP